jgi:hypothetical protein
MDDTQNDESVDRSGGAAVSRMVDDQQSVGNEDSVPANEDQNVSLGDNDYQENNHRVCSKRKRPRAEFPCSYTHDWSKGDPPKLRGK